MNNISTDMEGFIDDDDGGINQAAVSGVLRKLTGYDPTKYKVP